MSCTTVDYTFRPRNKEEMVRFMVESASDFLENHLDSELEFYRHLNYASASYHYRHMHIGTGEKMILRQIAIRFLTNSDPKFWWYGNAYGYGHIMLFFFFYGLYDLSPERR